MLGAEQCYGELRELLHNGCPTFEARDRVDFIIGTFLAAFLAKGSVHQFTRVWGLAADNITKWGFKH